MAPNEHLTLTLQRTGLAASLVAAGTLGGVVTYRRATEFAFDLGADPALVDVNLTPTGETVIFFVGFCVALMVAAFAHLVRGHLLTVESHNAGHYVRDSAKFALAGTTVALLLAGASVGIAAQSSSDAVTALRPTPVPAVPALDPVFDSVGIVYPE